MKPTGCTTCSWTLPRVERDQVRAWMAAKIAARQVCFQQSARRIQVAPLRRGAFAKRDLELGGLA